MKKTATTAVARADGPSRLDSVFAAGCTAVFLTLVASLAGAVTVCLR